MDFDLGTKKIYTCTSAGDRSIEFSLVIKRIKVHRSREVAKPEIGLFIFAVENFLHFRGI